MLRYNLKLNRLQFVLSTKAQLWSTQFNVRTSIWVHLLFAWNRTQGLAVYENGELLTKEKKGVKVRYPSFVNKFETLTVGDPSIVLNLRSGASFEIGHLVIWIRRLRSDEIKMKAFMAVIREDSTSRQCCRKKSGKQFQCDCFIWLKGRGKNERCMRNYGTNTEMICLLFLNAYLNIVTIKQRGAL